MPTAGQKIPNTHQWSNWKAVFSTWSERQLRDATIGELLSGVFSVRSMLRCYKQNKFKVYLVVRQSLARKDVNTEDEGSTALEAISRQRLAKTYQIEKT
jgi:hypothetical protein